MSPQKQMKHFYNCQAWPFTFTQRKTCAVPLKSNMFNYILDHQLYMVAGLTGVSVMMAFRLGSVTTPIQQMVDYLVLVTLEDLVPQKLLKH